MNSMIPFLPSSAPFTPEQRAWLNGYFVGLFSNANLAGSLAPAPAAPAAEPLLIGFGSQTGAAEQLARRLAKESQSRGFSPQVQELNKISLAQVTQLTQPAQSGSPAQPARFIVVTSTWGDGDPPDNALEFWQALSAETAPRLEGVHFAVLALGDRNYSDFCGAGRKIDERLAALGATRLAARADCDVDYESAAAAWMGQLWTALQGMAAPASVAKVESLPATPPAVAESRAETWSRAKPFPGRLITSRVLNGSGSAKETRHIEISLAGSGLSYEPGDALGVVPRNCPKLIEELALAAGWNLSATVSMADGVTMPFEEALLTRCDLRKPTAALLEAVAKATGGEPIARLLAPSEKPALQEYLAAREVIDLLLEFAHFRPSEGEFVPLLGKLQPRLYSISSSLRAFPDEVHLTVGVVRYESAGRSRQGLCSNFLANRVPAGSPVPVYIQPSHGFKLPGGPETPVIMVGPGTGIAPFRAFLHERRVAGAAGQNWLFFGDQKAACDFLYADELAALQSQGVLTRLDLAFSRDQEAKIYVQDRMLEQGQELFAWLENGAHFYVCGDAKRMAKDVDRALHQVIERAGRSAEQAAEYVQNLKSQKRYQRDVY